MGEGRRNITQENRGTDRGRPFQREGLLEAKDLDLTTNVMTREPEGEGLMEAKDLDLAIEVMTWEPEGQIS